MRFQLVDRIDAWEANTFIRGRKLTSCNEAFWQRRGAYLYMPEPLVLEALCQLGAWLAFLSTKRRKRAALLSVGSVDFLDVVRPGDVLELQARILAMGEDIASVSGQGSVAGRLVLQAEEILCALIASEELEDPYDTDRRLHVLIKGTSV